MSDHDLTTLGEELAPMGVTEELRILLADVHRLRGRARDAGIAYRQAREDAQTLPKRLAAAERDAAAAGEEPPDQAAMIRESETAVAAAQARMKGAEEARVNAERAVQRHLRERGDADRAAVAETVAARRDAALEKLEQASAAVADLAEAAAVLDALAPRDVNPVSPRTPSVVPATAHPIARAFVETVTLAERAAGDAGLPHDRTPATAGAGHLGRVVR